MTGFAKLQIRSGFHTGAAQTLPSRGVTIGSSIKADIVLTDPSVAPLHARVTCLGSRLDVEALEAAASLNGSELASGGTIASRYPARLTLGNVEMDVVHLPGALGFSVPSHKTVMAAACGILIVFTAAVLAWPDAKPSMAALQRAANAAVAEDGIRKPDSLAVPAEPEMVQAAATSFRGQLLAVGIETVDAVPADGFVRAKGAIKPSEENAWRAAQIWFDSTFGRNVVLQSEVAISAAKIPSAPIGIQSVWAGKRPYLIDGHGDKYFEGSVVKNGWVVEKIEDGKVTLRKNEEVIRLDL
jgi:type III secretion protein D